MRSIGPYSCIKRKFVVMTNSDHLFKIAGNILNRNFNADRPNHKWAADITYIPTKQGWLYLAVVLDLFSRRIVGWSMSDVQYAASDFQDLLEDNDIICSMSRKGNCWDNAFVESFGNLKNEWIRDKVYETMDDAKKRYFQLH